MGSRTNHPWSAAVKLILAMSAILFFCSFTVLAVIRLDADLRGRDKPSGWVFDWTTICIPFAVSLSLIIIWMVVNFFTHAPVTGEQAGAGGQLYYNLVTQLLIKKVDTRSIDNLNQGSILRDILRLVGYAAVIVYSVLLLVTVSCLSCNVPWKMIAVGFCCSYFLRSIMLFWNGFYSFHRLNDMKREVRVYQEALNTTRLFDQSIPYLNTKTPMKQYAPFVDLFLWLSVLTFATLGTLWFQKDQCASSCPTAFHLYFYLLLAVFVIEGANLLSKAVLIYYARLSYIENFDLLMDLIIEHNEKEQRHFGELMDKRI